MGAGGESRDAISLLPQETSGREHQCVHVAQGALQIVTSVQIGKPVCTPPTTTDARSFQASFDYQQPNVAVIFGPDLVHVASALEHVLEEHVQLVRTEASRQQLASMRAKRPWQQ